MEVADRFKDKYIDPFAAAEIANLSQDEYKQYITGLYPQNF